MRSTANAPNLTPPSRTDQLGRPKKTALLAAQRIVSEITGEGLRPGDRLPPEREMLTTLGIARGTLREALRFLEVQGVITLRSGPNGGPVVSAPDATHLASTLALTMHLSETKFGSIVETRRLVEPMLAGQACSRITPELLAELEDSITTMQDAVDDEATFFVENHHFHTVIAAASGNELLGLIVAAVGWISDGRPLGVSYSLRHRNAIIDMHRRILVAIKGKKEKLATDTMREHIDEYEFYLRRRFPKVMTSIIEWDTF